MIFSFSLLLLFSLDIYRSYYHIRSKERDMRMYVHTDIQADRQYNSVEVAPTKKEEGMD